MANWRDGRTFYNDITVRGNQDIYDVDNLDAESLQDGAFGSFTNWDDLNDFNEGTNNYAYLHSSGAGTLTQTTANLTIAGVPSRWYKFVYTISAVTATGALAGTITSAFALTAQTLTVAAAGTFTLVFKSATSPGDFVISCTSDTSSDGFTIDTLSLKEINGDINAGTATIGHIKIDDNTISTTDTNGTLIIAPNGTGVVEIVKDADIEVDIGRATIGGMAGQSDSMFLSHIDQHVIGSFALRQTSVGTTHVNGDALLNFAVANTVEVTLQTNLFQMQSGTILDSEDTTDSTSGSTGSIHTDGGLGVLLDLFVGAKLITAGTTSKSDGGAIPITAAIAELSTPASGAFTLAYGVEGQHLEIVFISDGGFDAVITPANGAGYATITMADKGDTATMLFTNAEWYVMGIGGLATGPVIAA